MFFDWGAASSQCLVFYNAVRRDGRTQKKIYQLCRRSRHSVMSRRNEETGQGKQLVKYSSGQNFLILSVRFFLLNSVFIWFSPSNSSSLIRNTSSFQTSVGSHLSPCIFLLSKPFGGRLYLCYAVEDILCPIYSAHSIEVPIKLQSRVVVWSPLPVCIISSYMCQIFTRILRFFSVIITHPEL